MSSSRARWRPARYSSSAAVSRARARWTKLFSASTGGRAFERASAGLPAAHQFFARPARDRGGRERLLDQIRLLALVLLDQARCGTRALRPPRVADDVASLQHRRDVAPG